MSVWQLAKSEKKCIKHKVFSAWINICIHFSGFSLQGYRFLLSLSWSDCPFKVQEHITSTASYFLWHTSLRLTFASGLFIYFLLCCGPHIWELFCLHGHKWLLTNCHVPKHLLTQPSDCFTIEVISESRLKLSRSRQSKWIYKEHKFHLTS